MVFYEKQTLLSLTFASLPAIVSAYFFFIRDKKNISLILLLTSAFLIRLCMISLDPYVHEWDERFHALVAKNMIESPLRPMLFPKHIMAYNLYDWAYMHIWVHKQPLFLWQMAISMKVFGISAIALRLPSAIMGTIMVWLTYDISRKWINNDNVAFIAAFLSTFAYYVLELTSGWMSLEHNDLAFTFYTTCCFWAFTRYIHSGYNFKWALWIGIFSGLSVLNKWLVGLLIFGGWGLYILVSEYRLDYKKYLHIIITLIVSFTIFLPWQLYIINAFPFESSVAFEYNRKHMSEALSHPGNAFFHFNFLFTSYHVVLIIFLVIGLATIFHSKITNSKLTISFVAMIAVVFSFFSFFVATKMPAFVYPVSALMFIIMAYGLYTVSIKLFVYLNIVKLHRRQLFIFITILAGLFSLKPFLIAIHRSENNQMRNNKIHNSSVFKTLDENITKKFVILNCRPYENIELMFYKDALAYHWYPSEKVLDSLQSIGYKFAAFEYKDDQQQLPDYILNDKEVLILDKALK